MLHCTMNTLKGSKQLKVELDDILGSLQFARRNEDLGRMALLTYWDVRRWARVANQGMLAEHAAQAITDHPHPTREEFLHVIDDVIHELESIQKDLH